MACKQASVLHAAREQLTRGNVRLREDGGPDWNGLVYDKRLGDQQPEEEPLSFPRAQGLGVVCSLRNACSFRRNAVISRIDAEHSPVTTTNARLWRHPPRSVDKPVVGDCGPRAQFPEGRLVPVLPIGVNRTPKARSFIALRGRLLSISRTSGNHSRLDRERWTAVR